MSPQSLTEQESQDDGKQFRAIPSINLITEEGNQMDAQQPEHSTDNPSPAQPDMQTTSQQHEKIDSTPTNPAKRSSPPNSSPPTPASAKSIISPLGRPPPSSKHHYLKEMWPGQPICHLCLKEYKKTNRAIRALPCGDIFHRACIDHLLGQKDGRCPSCESSIPAEWYMPHIYDAAKPAGSPCLCHPVSKSGTATTTDTKSEGTSSTGPGVLAIRKTLKRTKETAICCALGHRPKRTYVSYKTEAGQTRYVESEMGVALPGPRRSGYADG